MSDPQVMSGQQTYPPTRCRCGHQAGLHVPRGKGRGYCQHPECTTCKAFDPVEEESVCPVCGAPWSVFERMRREERDA